MENEKYKTIYKDLNKVWNYIDDLQTLLDWLKDDGVLTDEQHRFVKFYDNSYTWWCGDKSIQLSPGEAFALQRLGFIFEEATNNNKIKTDKDEPELMAVEKEINNENA